jgi:hypothetical protein
MLTERDGSERPGRRRRALAVEVRAAEERPSAEDLRRREQELERLIIKAACHRARRLAGQSGGDALRTAV